MSLCLFCGKIDEHAKGCAQAAADAFEATPKLGEKADQLFRDLVFAKKALELLHAAHLRRREVAQLKLDELTRVPDLGFDPKEHDDPTDPSAVVRAACEAIERRLTTTA